MDDVGFSTEDRSWWQPLNHKKEVVLAIKTQLFNQMKEENPDLVSWLENKASLVLLKKEGVLFVFTQTKWNRCKTRLPPHIIF